MKKKLLSIALVGTMAFSTCAIVGCSPAEKFDETKTHLIVGVYDGGFGADSWEKMEKDFEALYANTSFEEGKVGVDVHINAKKDEYLGSTLENNIIVNDEDMYFTNANIQNLAAAGKIIDLTDVVTNTTDAKYSMVYNDAKTIEEKMTDTVKAYTQKSDPNYTANSYKYYGVPVFVSTNSLIYDVDLWEEEELYFTRDYETGDSDVIWTSGLEGQPEKSYGQDGIKGTLDDGLPITWEDFQNMLTQIKSKNCTAITVSGANQVYSREFFVQFYANYEGANDFSLNLTFEGTDTDPAIGDVTSATGYKVMQQKGRQKVLEFAEWIVAQGGYLSTDVTSSATHTDTQDHFLYSAVNGNMKRIAMLIEGNWWEHEAQGTLTSMANKYPQYKDRRFGVMTFPIMDGGDARVNNGGNVVFSIQPESYAFIASKSKVQEVAKLFLAFTTDDTYLSYYTSVSGAPRPFKYAIEEEHYATMSYYKKSVWETYKGVMDGTTTLVYKKGTNPISMYSIETVLDKWTFQCNWSDKSLNEPFSAFTYYSTSGLTAEIYAELPYNKYAGSWVTTYYNTYFKN